jgi:hypothetical protein
MKVENRPSSGKLTAYFLHNDVPDVLDVPAKGFAGGRQKKEAATAASSII